MRCFGKGPSGLFLLAGGRAGGEGNSGGGLSGFFLRLSFVCLSSSCCLRLSVNGGYKGHAGTRGLGKVVYIEIFFLYLYYLTTH